MTNSNEDLDPHIADLVAESMADLIWKEDEPVNNTEQVPTPTIDHVLYQYEQRCHRHRIESLSEGELTARLLREKAEAKAAVERICASEQIAAIELLYWKYKEMNDQSADMKFAEAFGIIRDGLQTQLEGETHD
jgi:hypothetical protein